MRFAEFDKDHDQRLDFKEFCAFQPAKIRAKVSENELRKWFDAADTDGNGTLTLNEFFTWSLGTSARRHGAQALEAAFSAYDKDGTGRLDAVEFTLAAEEMGFGNAAHQIFEQLDADGSGSITYAELVASLTEPPDDGATTSMLTAMVWAQELSSYNDSEALDTSTWIIRGRDVDSVRSELRHLMTESGATVADLLKHFDMDNEQRAAKASIDMMEFRTAMVKGCGYRGTPEVLQQIFDSMDWDRSGTIGFDELYEFIHGHRHSLDKRNRKDMDLTLRMPFDTSAEELAWSVETLRVLIRDVMHKNNMGAADLLLSWLTRRARAAALAASSSAARMGIRRTRTPGGFRTDRTGEYDSCDRGGRRGLNRASFIAKVKASFFTEIHPDLWSNEVEKVVSDTFFVLLTSLKGENFLNEVGVAHFERWLQLRNQPQNEDDVERLPRKTAAQLRDVRERRQEASYYYRPRIQVKPEEEPVTIVILRPSSAPPRPKKLCDAPSVSVQRMIIDMHTRSTLPVLSPVRRRGAVAR